MGDLDELAFDLLRLAPELQIKVFEALPSPWAAAALRLTCRDLNALFVAYRTQIEAAMRDNMVAPFYEYYAFLSTLHIPESAIKHPPVGGWPNITPESCSAYDKSDFVVEVLRHLPYIVDDGPNNLNNIDYSCNVVDYSTASRKPQLFLGAETRYEWTAQKSLDSANRHQVLIACPYPPDGIDLYLDTRTGLIYEAIIKRPGETLPSGEYFELKTKQCRELRQVFVPGEDTRSGGFDEEEAPYDAAAMEEAGEPSCPYECFNLAKEMDREWVRHLYRKFGWPGEGWRKEEGLKAIEEYTNRRHREWWEGEAEKQRKRAELLSRLGPTIGVLHCM